MLVKTVISFLQNFACSFYRKEEPTLNYDCDEYVINLNLQILGIETPPDAAATAAAAVTAAYGDDGMCNDGE